MAILSAAMDSFITDADPIHHGNKAVYLPFAIAVDIMRHLEEELRLQTLTIAMAITTITIITIITIPISIFFLQIKTILQIYLQWLFLCSDPSLEQKILDLLLRRHQLLLVPVTFLTLPFFLLHHHLQRVTSPVKRSTSLLLLEEMVLTQ